MSLLSHINSFRYLDDNVRFNQQTQQYYISEDSESYTPRALADIFTQITGITYTEQDILNRFGLTEISDYDIYNLIDKRYKANGEISKNEIIDFMQPALDSRNNEKSPPPLETYTAQDIVDMIFMYTGEKIDVSDLVTVLKGQDNFTAHDVKRLHLSSHNIKELFDISNMEFNISLRDIEQSLVETGMLGDYLQNNVWR